MWIPFLSFLLWTGIAVIVCGIAWKPQPVPFGVAFGVGLIVGGPSIGWELVKAWLPQDLRLFVAVWWGLLLRAIKSVFEFISNKLSNLLHAWVSSNEFFLYGLFAVACLVIFVVIGVVLLFIMLPSAQSFKPLPPRPDN